MRYVHTNIISKNWQKLVDFYIHVFACELVPPLRNQSGAWLEKGTGVRNASLKGAHLRLPGHGSDGPTLEIYQYGETIEGETIYPNTRGFGHIAFEVEDVKAVVEKLLAHGGTKSGEITERKIEGVGRITFIYVRDPDGNLIELQHWDKA
ncbi:MAG: VOC family protein [Bacteroidota bacterium]